MASSTSWLVTCVKPYLLFICGGILAVLIYECNKINPELSKHGKEVKLISIPDLTASCSLFQPIKNLHVCMV